MLHFISPGCSKMTRLEKLDRSFLNLVHTERSVVEALALMFLHCVLENVDLRATALQKHCL